MKDWPLLLLALFLGGGIGAMAVSVVLTHKVQATKEELEFVVDQRNHLSEQLADMTRQRNTWIEMYGILADEKNVLNVDK